MSKHTYLYPLPASARFLWMLGRANSSDLFGYPDDKHWAGCQMAIRLDDEIARARAAVMGLIEDRPRVCLGFGYTIPNSQIDAEYHDTHESTRILTRYLWDGAIVDDRIHAYLMQAVKRPGVPDRSSPEEFDCFLTQHKGQLIIPVWM
jgi:hypothetical protein